VAENLISDTSLNGMVKERISKEIIIEMNFLCFITEIKERTHSKEISSPSTVMRVYDMTAMNNLLKYVVPFRNSMRYGTESKFFSRNINFVHEFYLSWNAILS
jgi:hypothetical protein